jgi:hypothetical protein
LPHWHYFEILDLKKGRLTSPGINTQLKYYRLLLECGSEMKPDLLLENGKDGEKIEKDEKRREGLLRGSGETWGGMGEG